MIFFKTISEECKACEKHNVCTHVKDFTLAEKRLESIDILCGSKLPFTAVLTCDEFKGVVTDEEYEYEYN